MANPSKFRTLLMYSITLLLAASELQANAAEPAPMPAPAATVKSNWSYYAGFAGGVDFLRGSRNIFETSANITRTSNGHLHANSGNVELFVGTGYRLPNSMFGFALDPYFSYSNSTSNDFTNAVIDQIGNVVINDSAATSWRSRFGGGADLKAVVYLGSVDSVFAMVGTQIRSFEMKYNDALFQYHKNFSLWALSWGLGYEHRFSQHSLGIKFRNDYFQDEHFNFVLGQGTFTGKMNPKIYSFMATYRYNFN